MQPSLEKHLISTISGIAAQLRVAARRKNSFPAKEGARYRFVYRALTEVPNIAGEPCFTDIEILNGIQELFKQVEKHSIKIGRSCTLTYNLGGVWINVEELPLDDWAK